MEAQRPQQPKGTLDERMARLENEFPPSLNVPSVFDKSLPREDLIENMVCLLERFEAYINNKNSDEKLWFQYGVATPM